MRHPASGERVEQASGVREIVILLGKVLVLSIGAALRQYAPQQSPRHRPKFGRGRGVCCWLGARQRECSTHQPACSRTVSAWGKEAGLKLKDVKTLLRHEDIATTSNVYGNLGMDAKRRIQQRLVAFVNERAKAAEDASRIRKLWARMPVSIQ
jgi:integrase